MTSMRLLGSYAAGAGTTRRRSWRSVTLCCGGGVVVCPSRMSPQRPGAGRSVAGWARGTSRWPWWPGGFGTKDSSSSAGDLAHLRLVALPLPGMEAVLQGRGDDGGHGVGPVGGHLVERAPGLGAVAAQPAGEAEHRRRRRADLVGSAAGEVGPQRDVGGGVLGAHVLPERVAGADRLQGHEHPGAVDVGEAVAVGVELLEAVQRPVALGAGSARGGRGPGRREDLGDRFTVPDQRGRQGGPTGRRLDGAGEDRLGGDPLGGLLGLQTGRRRC